MDEAKAESIVETRATVDDATLGATGVDDATSKAEEAKRLAEEAQRKADDLDDE